MRLYYRRRRRKYKNMLWKQTRTKRCRHYQNCFVCFVVTAKRPAAVGDISAMVRKHAAGYWPDQIWNTRPNTTQLFNIIVKFSYYRQDAAKRQTAGIKFTHRAKISIFAPQGRLVAPIHVKFGKTKGHVGPLGYAKFHVNRFTGWERGPKNIKKFHFLVESRRRWEPIDRFLKFLRAFICLTILKLVF